MSRTNLKLAQKSINKSDGKVIHALKAKNAGGQSFLEKFTPQALGALTPWVLYQNDSLKYSRRYKGESNLKPHTGFANYGFWDTDN